MATFGSDETGAIFISRIHSQYMAGELRGELDTQVKIWQNQARPGALWRALKGRCTPRPHSPTRKENWAGCVATHLGKGSAHSRTAGIALGKPETKTKSSQRGQFVCDQLTGKVGFPALHDSNPRLNIFVHICSASNRGQQINSQTRNSCDTCIGKG